MKDKDNTIIKTISVRDHILLRPNMYIGGIKPTEKEDWLLKDDETIEFKKVTYPEGLLKIINEAIDNAIDEGIKTDWEHSNKIKITINEKTCSVEDNGRGIPTEKNEDGVPYAVVATTVPMSGSNFEDGSRETIGMNGIGIKGAAVFSKEFECITCDGKGKLKITSKNNLSDVKVKNIGASSKTGTTVTFTPDFERFGVKGFDDVIINLLKTRLKFLSWYFPKCSITFNGEKLNIKAKEIPQMFPQPAITINEPDVLISVYPSDDPFALSYVNGLYLKRNGTHVDYVLDKVIKDIREKVSKKYKAIKPADIKNRLGIVVFFKGFPNCTFNSQTKDEITNTAAEVGEYLRSKNVDLDAFTTRILKTKPIIDNIVELFRLKEELAEKKQLDAMNKTKKEVISNKYYPPVTKSGQKYLMITEGESAFSGISPILGRKGIGYYQLMGKPLNIHDKSATGKGGYMFNVEIKELVNILGLDLNGETQDMNYDYVVVLSDADPDGTAIAGLLITMFNKLAPKMVEAGRICRLNTPLLIGLKGDKVQEYYFKFPDEKSLKKNLDYQYLKGLGSWTKSRLNQVIEMEGGMEKLLLRFDMDETAKESIEKWFGKDSDPRKDALRGKEFHINNA